jgi:hypothetical protein
LVRMLKFLQPDVRQPGPRQAADSTSRSPSSLMRPVTECYVWKTIGTFVLWYVIQRWRCYANDAHSTATTTMYQHGTHGC